MDADVIYDDIIIDDIISDDIICKEENMELYSEHLDI